MVKNNKEINSKKAVEGTLCKIFGFKKNAIENDQYWLDLKIKCKDFNIILIVENLETICMLIETKNKVNEMEVMECKYNFQKLSQLVNRYKALK